MNSCAWMYGHYQQVGQSSQAASQVTCDKMRNQQPGAANTYCRFMKTNSGVRQQQNALPNFSDGGNRPVTYCQTSAALHQTVSSQQLAGQKDSHFYQRSSLQSSSGNVQSQNPGLLVPNGFQGSTQHNSPPVVSQRSSPNVTMENTTYPQQNVPPYWNQPVHKKSLMQTQDGNIVSDPKHYGVQRTVHQNVKRKLMQHNSAYSTALSLMCKQSTSKITSANASNRQAVHIQIHNQNGAHQGPPSSSPPSYAAAVHQSVRNTSYTAKSLLNEQMLHASSMNQKTQQFAPQLSTTQSRGQEATCIVNLNPYSRPYEMNNFLSKTNPISYSPPTGTQQKMPTVARVVDSLQTTDLARSDAYRLLRTTSSSREKQVHGEVRMMESNLHQQPLTTAKAHFYNSNSEFPSADYRQHFSNDLQNVMSTIHHSANVSPQQNSAAADSLSITAARHGSEIGNQADSTLSRRSVAGYSNDTVIQLKQMFDKFSPPMNNPKSSAANGVHEILVTLPPGQQMDSSGTRVVAIVQPLSQECHREDSGECSTAEKCQIHPDHLCASPVSNKQKAVPPGVLNPCTENVNQIRPNEFATNQLATPSDQIVWPSTGLVKTQGLCPKQLDADDTIFEPTSNMQVDQRVEIAAQQSVTSEVPDNQKSKMNKRKMPSELSSLPTTPWTTVMLSNLIMNEEKAQQEVKDFTEPDSARKVLNMFWDGNCKTLADKLKAGWYKNLITEVREFCHEEVSEDAVVLFQVTASISKTNKSFHVLKHNEVYSQPTYKSSWLNVNERVDDIDKEFGFSWPLKYHHIVLERDSELDKDKGISSTPAQIEIGVLNKVPSQTNPAYGDSDREKQAPTPESTSPQNSSPSKTGCEDSSDPLYAFEIQVLPPEKAKMIFEQVQSKIAQSVDMHSQSEEVVKTPKEAELHEVKDVTPEKSKLRGKSVSAIEKVCCLSMWLELFVGSDGRYEKSKCQCKEEQRRKSSAVRTPVKNETTAERSSIKIDPKFHCAVKGESQSDCDDQASGMKKMSFVTFSCPDFSDEDSQNTDLNEANKPDIYSKKETEDISHICINSLSSNVLISGDKAEKNSCSENEFIEQIPALGTMKDPEEECAKDQRKSSVNSPIKDSENTTGTEVANENSLDEEYCKEGQQTCTDVTTSSPESRKGKYKAVKRKRKILSNKRGILPFLKVIKKSKPDVDLDSQPVLRFKNDFVDVPETKALAPKGRTVQLMLFGSASEDKNVRTDSRTTQVPSQKSVAARTPPKVLFMQLSPLKKKGHVPSGTHSAKQRAYEKWRSSLPAPVKQRGKVRMQKCAFSSMSRLSYKKAETVTDTMEPPVSSETRTWNKKSKCSLSLKRRRSLSTGGKSREDKMKNGGVAVKHSVDQVRGKSENGSRAGAMPLKEKIVLRFNVLPNTFEFKYGSSEMKEITDTVSDKPAENGGKCPNKTKMRETVGSTWYPNPEKYCPPTSPTEPKTPGLFQEFQKKYVQKTQKNK